MSAYQLKLYNDAVLTLENGLRLADGYRDIQMRMFSLLGECCNAIKDYVKSDIYFEDAIRLDTKNIVVLNNYSYYLALRSEKLDIALNYIKKCLNIDPKNSTFLDTYGWILFKSGKPGDAKHAIEDALTNGGLSNVGILEHYGEILVTLHNLEEALKYYRMIKALGKESNRLKELLNLPQ
jgi:tetratricopeptide (TPR) repeat protein